MAIIGTFSSFTTARLAIYASQASLNVTGNNIANINTPGYTRQRMDLVSLYSTGAPKFANLYNTNIGYGVLTNGATQLRDPYLDIRYRDENCKLEQSSEWLDGLTQLSRILDEVGETKTNDGFGVINAQLGNLFTALQKLSTQVSSENADSLVRAEAETLTKFLNQAAEELQTIWNGKEKELTDSVDEVNKLLTDIRDLNDQIRTQSIYGDKALELRDARNLALDELSKYMNINVEYSMERIDQFTEVEKLTVTIANSKGPDGEPIKLVDGIYGGQITMPGTMPEENPNADNKAILDAMEKAREAAEAAGATKEEIAAAVEQARADAEKKFGKYLVKDTAGNVTGATDDITKASAYSNYDAEDPTAEDINRYLLQVEQLVDQRGRVMKDKNEPSGKSEIVTLGDTTLCGKSDDPLRGDSTPAGTLQAIREMLTRKGEYSSPEDQALDPSCTTKRGLPYYQAALDNLAQKFAAVFNKENQLPASTVYKNNGINFFDADGKKLQYTDANGQLQDITLDMVTRVVKDKDGKPVLGDDGQPLREPLSEPLNTPKDIALAAECLNILRQKGEKVDGYGYYQGGVLFSNRGDNDDPTGITAANISVSDSWDNHSVRILNTKEKSKVSAETGEMSHTTARDNISHFISLFDQKMDYLASESRENATLSDLAVHKGSFREVFTAISGTLGNDKQAIAGKVENYTVSALSLENNRQSVSGVDLNEEATSMMQFSKSYSAACRLLTTIDSMLDTLINGTAR